jgi:hypothetical protein
MICGKTHRSNAAEPLAKGSVFARAVKASKAISISNAQRIVWSCCLVSNRRALCWPNVKERLPKQTILPHKEN